jgi:hypothetical protein
MEDERDAWIRKTDEALSRSGVLPRQRPWKALGELSTYLKKPIALNDPEARRVFEWFEKNSREGTHNIGSLYRGVHYFDHEVWPISIPLAYGTCQLDLERSIAAMPDGLRKRLLLNSKDMTELSSVWVDCLDYGYGMDDLEKASALPPLSMQFLLAADKELRSTVGLLLERPPSQKAIETARMATEMFLKMYVIHHEGVDEQAVKTGIGHNLEKVLQRCLLIRPRSDLGIAAPRLAMFPSIDDRYKPGDRPLRHLWAGYSTAQFIGTTIVRELSGRDCRGSVRVS